MDIRVEINDISNQKIEAINATKSQFFEKMNKINKSLARLIKEKERILKSGMKKRTLLPTVQK